MAEDHLLVRNGLKHIFEYFDDVSVAAEAGTGDEVLEALKRNKFDLILLDVNMPGPHGMELIAKIIELPEHPPILMLSMYNDVQVVKQMLKAGADGYITKDASPEELVEAVRIVAEGGRYLASCLAENLAFETNSSAAFIPHELLSARELIILRMLAKGVKIKEIAKELGISNKTVSSHKARIMQKMQIPSDAKLMQYVAMHGFAL